MKKVGFLILVAVMLLSISTTAVSLADTRQPSIEINLNNDGTAKVSYGGQTFDIKYQRLHDRVLIGREQHHDLLYLLNKASDISGEKYDLTIKHRAWVSPPKCFGIDITAYEGVGDMVEIYKTLEFNSPISNDGKTYGNALSENKAGNTYYTSTNGDYVYYLPLRYIFEQLGFTVNYQDEKISITNQ